jgi:hypothetical protein
LSFVNGSLTRCRIIIVDQNISLIEVLADYDYMTDGLDNLHLSNSFYSPNGLEIYQNSGVAQSYHPTIPSYPSLSHNTAAAANTWTTATTNSHPFIATQPGGEQQYNNSFITNNTELYQQQSDLMIQPQKVMHYVIHHESSSSSVPPNCELVINVSSFRLNILVFVSFQLIS